MPGEEFHILIKKIELSTSIRCFATGTRDVRLVGETLSLLRPGIVRCERL